MRLFRSFIAISLSVLLCWNETALAVSTRITSPAAAVSVKPEFSQEALAPSSTMRGMGIKIFAVLSVIALSITAFHSSVNTHPVVIKTAGLNNLSAILPAIGFYVWSLLHPHRPEPLTLQANNFAARRSRRKWLRMLWLTV